MKATFRGGKRPHLTAKKVYSVLEVSGGFLRVIDDGGAPALVPSARWEIKAQPIANGWHMDLRDGDVSLGPAPFLEVGFFERLFDRDRAAGEAFLVVAAASCSRLEVARFRRWFHQK